MFSWFGRVSFVPYSKVSDFAVHLKDGRLMGSRCKGCGYKTFPPVADCPKCMSASARAFRNGSACSPARATRNAWSRKS